jgi:hypothetical protein
MLIVKNKDIKDIKYNSLILYALLRCDSFSFTVPDLFTKPSSDVRSNQYINYKEYISDRLENFDPYIVRKYVSEEYVNRILGNFTEIYVATLNIDILGGILATDGLYSWKYPDMPEDLCLFSKGKCWLKSVAHEKICWIYTDSEIEKDILKKVIGLKFIEVDGEDTPTLDFHASMKKVRLENKKMIGVRKVVQEENQVPIKGVLDCKENLIKTLLCDSEDTNQIVDLYSDTSNTDKFSAGFIVALSSDDVVIAHIAPGGKYDGFMLKKIDNIFRADIGSKYDATIQKLYLQQSQAHTKFRSEFENLSKGFLYFAKTNNYVATIELLDSNLEDVKGFIDDVAEDTVKIRKLNQYGESDGYSIVYIDDISFITCDSDDEHALKILFEKIQVK